MECLREAPGAEMLVDGMSPEAGAVVVLGSILAIFHAAPRVANDTGAERLFGEVWSGIQTMVRRPAGGGCPSWGAGSSGSAETRKT